MRTRGVTLLEILCVLALLGAGVAAFLPMVRAQADRLAVRAAREDLIGLVRRARSTARLSGGAHLILEDDSDPLLVTHDGTEARRLELGARGVGLEVAGARSSVRLSFGPLGIARWGAATFRMRRGEASASVVVSSYGRIRR